MDAIPQVTLTFTDAELAALRAALLSAGYSADDEAHAQHLAWANAAEASERRVAEHGARAAGQRAELYMMLSERVAAAEEAAGF